jgi:hypothetical protein
VDPVADAVIETQSSTRGGRKMLRGLAQCVTLSVVAVILLGSISASADPVVSGVFEAAGAAPADIQAAVDAFRAFLGTNNGVGGSVPRWPPGDQLGWRPRCLRRPQPITSQLL